MWNVCLSLKTAVSPERIVVGSEAMTHIIMHIGCETFITGRCRHCFGLATKIKVTSTNIRWRSTSHSVNRSVTSPILCEVHRKAGRWHVKSVSWDDLTESQPKTSVRKFPHRSFMGLVIAWDHTIAENLKRTLRSVVCSHYAKMCCGYVWRASSQNCYPLYPRLFSCNHLRITNCSTFGSSHKKLGRVQQRDTLWGTYPVTYLRNEFLVLGGHIWCFILVIFVCAP